MNRKKIQRMSFAVLMAILLSLPWISRTEAKEGALKAQEWKYSCFLPPRQWSNWCNSWLLDEIEKRTDGKIKIQYYVAQALGKAVEHYSMVSTGRVEMGEFTTGFGPGVFPLSSVLQLPFSWNNSLLGSVVANELLKKGYLDDTYRKDVKVIALNLTETLKIWTLKPVSSMDGLKGLRLRVAGGLDAQTIGALGAAAISMPLPEVYPALEKGVLDGGVFGFRTGMDFKYPEVTNYVMDVPICIAVHMNIMNKKLWDSLPKDTQATLDQLFSEYVFHWSNTIDLLEEEAKDIAVEKFGVKIAKLPAAEIDKMKAATAHVKDEWIAEMEKKGLPGQKNYDALTTTMKNLGIILDQTWVTNRALGKK
ncbi:MAG: TRAP transporter substrate-binding protein [Desulfobacterales bacterium]|nr:TRAP transporter substrate-binding protein [Desulfobacterales bacterium]